MTQDELIQFILQELKDIKKGLPNGELKRIEKHIESMQADINEMKTLLMDPNQGLIVETNKNTEFRKERTAKIPYYDAQVHQLDKIVEWKATVNKALWIGFTAIVTLFTKLITDIFKG